MVVYDFPWPHAVIDDLVDLEFQDRLSLFADRAQQRGDFGLWHFDHGQFTPEIQALYFAYRERLDRLLPHILNCFPHRRDHERLQFTSHLAVQPADYVYRPHCDHPDKIISIIGYIAPKHSRGTCLHTTQESSPSIVIDWRPGRALIFAGRDDVTWHSYGSGADYRATLCSFFIRPGQDPSR